MPVGAGYVRAFGAERAGRAVPAPAIRKRTTMSLYALVPEHRARVCRPAGAPLLPTPVASRIRHPVSYRASVHFPVRAMAATTNGAAPARRIAPPPAAPDHRILNGAYTGVS